MTKKEILEAAAKRAENILIDESYTLWDIRDSYIDAQLTGYHNGRKIPQSMAAGFANTFRERAEAVFNMVDHVKKAILNEEGK